jgi:hypothetical protein
MSDTRPETRERKIFPSRKTSFPIFSRDVGDSWLQLLNLALRIGSDKETGAGPAAEVLNAMVTIGLPVIAEDLEVEVVPPEDFPGYLAFDREEFERHYARLEVPCFDALRKALAASGMAALAPDALRKLDVASDLLSATFNLVEGRLYGSFVLGCVELFRNWPIDALSLVRLQRQLAAEIGSEADATTFVIHSAQLLASDWERTERVLEESFKRPLPLQVDHSGVFLFGSDNGQARGMLLDHDAGNIFWEDAFADAQQLSWYIVDAMPWLLPQHIRYVGQECATLMRAMRERECYLQG